MTDLPGPEPPLPPSIALVIGSEGGIGSALVRELEASGRFSRVIGLGRRTDPPLDLLDEASVATALGLAASAGDLRLVIHAAGVLHGPGLIPEKSLSRIDPEAMALAFAVNATGPALVMKHLAPRLPRRGRLRRRRPHGSLVGNGRKFVA